MEQGHGEGRPLADTPMEAAARDNVAIAVVRDNDVSRHVWLGAESGALAGSSWPGVGVFHLE